MPAKSSAAVPRRRASCSSHPPAAPTAAPTPAPMSSSTAALPGPSALSRPAAAAAPAIATMTTGVAMPSLRPLSTVISWRIRDGTAGLVTTGTPECGVGRGQRRADEQGQPEPELGEEPGGQGPPEHDRQGQADAQQPHVAAHVPAQLLERQAGGVGEEHPHQGDLDQRGDTLRGRRAMDQPGPGQGRADSGEHDRSGQVRLLQPRRHQRPREQERR